MKKNDVFTFTAPNGAEVQAVCVDKVGFNVYLRTATTNWLCYAQNRLFLCLEKEDTFTQEMTIEYCAKVLVDYAILPDYDALLEDYQHKLDKADDYADKTL